MLRFILSMGVLLSSSALAATGNTVAQLFADQNINGTLVIASLHDERTIIHNERRAAQRFSPASTFKIFNTLIALQHGAVSDKYDVFRWDGQRHDFAVWNSDQTLASAFKVSCVWCYQELASRVGKEPYRHHIAEAGYGTLRPDFDTRNFWLDDSLQVSAMEQVAFLKKVYLHALPFSPQTYATLQDIMRVQQTPAYTLYAKTGWSARTIPQIGWYVGYIETAGKVWVFAMNMELRSEADLPLRQKLTHAALDAAAIMPRAAKTE